MLQQRIFATYETIYNRDLWKRATIHPPCPCIYWESNWRHFKHLL